MVLLNNYSGDCVNPLKEYKLPIAVTAAIVAMAVMIGASACSPRWYYRFREEPTVAPTTDETTETDERESAVLTYGYESLDEKLRQAYQTLDTYVQRDYSERFSVALSTDEELLNVIEAYEQDHPEVFWLDNSSRYQYLKYSHGYEVELSFTFQGDALREAKKEVEEAAAAVIDAAPENATDYELELFFNEWIVYHCSYDKEGPQRHNAYGTFIQGRAVCDGYSKAFQLLCQRAGIDCVCVEGTATEFESRLDGSEDDGHMWNCVKLGGDWYHVDVTWNDGDAHIQKYAFLNLSTEEIKRTHAIGPMFGEVSSEECDYLNTFVPECNSMEYNYFYKSCPCISDLEDDGEVIAALIQTAKKHGMYLDVRIDSALDYDETTQAISESYGYRWLEAANHYNNDEPRISAESKYYIYKEMDVITFNLAYE